MNVGEWEKRAAKKKKKRELDQSEKGEDSQGASKIAGRESSSWWNSIIREVTQPQSSGAIAVMWGKRSLAWNKLVSRDFGLVLYIVVGG